MVDLSLSGESAKFLGKLLAFAREERNIGGLQSERISFEALSERNPQKPQRYFFSGLNEEEAAVLTGLPFSEERRVFKKLDALMPDIVAVTNGAKGVTVSDGKFIYRAPAFRKLS